MKIFRSSEALFSYLFFFFNFFYIVKFLFSLYNNDKNINNYSTRARK